ncbi:MAG: class I SAM-dependent methyltransferase [bacterium]
MIKSIHTHFSTIAQKYRELRTTDLEPILYLREELQKLHKIEAADVGCGDGSYVLKLFQYLGDKLYLYCIDRNKEMLGQLKEYLTQHKIGNFQIKQSLAENLTIQDESFDCVFTFNTIHLFKILAFLKEASRVLKDEGYLFIYTRLRSQNIRSIWGKYFPLFNQKETRLYELEELKSIIEEMPRLEIQNMEFFKYKRVSRLDWLVEQARNHHYSTFHIYTKDEFEKSLNQFKENLRRNFRDINNISWVDGNVLFVIRKRMSQLLDAAF